MTHPHIGMLLDRHRNLQFARAIHKLVRRGDVVVDIGTGTGLLAMLAARAGARRVYAIERDPVVHQAEILAERNGVRDRIEFLHAEAEKVELGTRADVVVTEMIGPVGYDENLAGVLELGRKRFLKKNGRQLTRTLRLGFLPLLYDRYKEFYRWPRQVCGLDYRSLSAWSIHRPLYHHRLGNPLHLPRKRVAPWLWLAPHDLLDATQALLPFEERLHWRATRSLRFNGMVAAFRCELIKGLWVDSRKAWHWPHVFFPLKGEATLSRGDLLEWYFGVNPDLTFHWAARVTRAGKVRFHSVHSQYFMIEGIDGCAAAASGYFTA